MKNIVKLLCVFTVLCLITGPVTALQISFPVDVGDGQQTARSISLKARSLKEYFDRFQMSYSGEAYRFGTYGDRSRAFRPDNTDFQNLFGLRAAKKLENGINLETNIGMRHTTDPIISNRRDLQFTSFYASAGRKDKWLLRVGDLYPNLSRYSFSRFAEGALGKYTQNYDKFNIKYDVVAARTQRARENNTVERYASAVAATFESPNKVRNKPSWNIGYRMSQADDQLNSVDNHGSIADLHIGVQSVVYGANSKSGWTMTGENAWSNGYADRKRDPLVRQGYAWLTNIGWRKSYRAKPFEGIARIRPVAFQFNWELVDPYFQTALGVAASDQKRWSARSGHKWNENLDWTLSHLRLEDNVRNQKLTTTVSRTTTVGVNTNFFKLFDPNNSTWLKLLPESIRNMKMRGEFRYNDRDASDNTVNAKIEDYVYSITYKNWGMSFKNDFSFQITDDDATPTN
ncbi:MAG: hypothetical protein JKX97_01440, partial [Candidatus Lindowbacteria bacterium]|nr:hypothetical protein [Candidatus Lindowbacteria bacterium]